MDYSKLSVKAKDKINKYGGDVAIIRNGDVTYNEETNTYDSNDVTISGKGILSSIDSSFINGTTVMYGDVSMMCYLDSEPVVNDKLIFGGKQYTVVNIESVNPDGKCVIYYNLQLR